MIYVGIDVAKNKHDCAVMGSDGKIYEKVFEIENSLKGFQTLTTCLKPFPIENVKIGLEATGHYSQNIINFLKLSGYDLVVYNPLITSKYRKAFSLRKTKTDKMDARTLARMLAVENSESYSPPSYHIHELKSLTRHRHRFVKQRSKLKTSLTRLVDIMFPELPKTVGSIHSKTIYALLMEFSTPSAIKQAHLTRLTNILGQYSSSGARDKANALREAASTSIGTATPALVFELRQIIPQIRFTTAQIDELEKLIKALLTEVSSPITSIPGISFTLGSIILAEIGDIERFDSPAQLLAFAGMEPSTNQSGKRTSTGDTMVKRGSPYLRHALYNAAQLISRIDPAFKGYFSKKLSENKKYEVAMSHVAKKLVRVLFYLLKNNESFQPQKH